MCVCDAGVGFIVYICALAVICSILYAFIKHVQPMKEQMVEAIQRYDEAIINEDARQVMHTCART